MLLLYHKCILFALKIIVTKINTINLFLLILRSIKLKE